MKISSNPKLFINGNAMPLAAAVISKKIKNLFVLFFWILHSTVHEWMLTDHLTRFYSIRNLFWHWQSLLGLNVDRQIFCHLSGQIFLMEVIFIFCQPQNRILLYENLIGVKIRDKILISRTSNEMEIIINS